MARCTNCTYGELLTSHGTRHLFSPVYVAVTVVRRLLRPAKSWRLCPLGMLISCWTRHLIHFLLAMSLLLHWDLYGSQRLDWNDGMLYMAGCHQPQSCFQKPPLTSTTTRRYTPDLYPASSRTRGLLWRALRSILVSPQPGRKVQWNVSTCSLRS